jgi:multiple antibiotic resistance protein
MTFHSFVLAFVPLFFAVDAIGILPLFVNLTEEMDPRERKKVVAQSLVTALGVAIGFVAFGQIVFRYLGITVQDFMVAGGLLLLLIAVSDLLSGEKLARKVGVAIGAVPIGMPLIVGPAVLTTALMLVDSVGWIPTVTAVVLNVGIAGAVLMGSTALMRLLGPSGSRVVSKVASLILAAIAVMMVRRGLTIMITHPQ